MPVAFGNSFSKLLTAELFVRRCRRSVILLVTSGCNLPAEGASQTLRFGTLLPDSYSAELKGEFDISELLCFYYALLLNCVSFCISELLRFYYALLLNCVSLIYLAWNVG